MKTISERLKYAIDEKNITKNALATGIGVHPSTIDNYIKNKVKNPNSLILETIAIFLKISPDWLILGMGDMYDKREDEVCYKDFENLSTDDKLDKIYTLLLELKKGQNILGEGLLALSKDG